MLPENVRKPLLIIISISLLCYTIWHEIHRDDLFVAREGVLLVGDAAIPVEVRSTTLGRAKGLSERKSLPERTGMFFVFDRSSIQHFWMKDMLFPLDIVWIDKGQVQAIETDIPHPAANNGEIMRMTSPTPSDMVLEINAGEAARLGIKPGDRVGFRAR